MTESSDKISVIIPCYNAEKYLDRCLQSVVDQTYPAECIEIICVNDASTDSTLDLLKSWESRYPENICVIDCEMNGHLGRARNIGMEYATGEWIAFIDADDWIEREYLSVLYKAASDKDLQIVSCLDKRDAAPGLEYFSEETVTVEDITDICNGKMTLYKIDSVQSRKNFFRTQPLKLYAWGKLIRKSFLTDNEIAFPELLAYEDIVWGNLVNMIVERAGRVDRIMYHYYVNPGSIVLKKNESYHVDHITTQEIMWAQLISRGFGDEYLPELQYEYLYNGYLAMLKILALRYDEPSYSVFRLLQELTRAKVPEQTCTALQADSSIPEIHRLLFGLIHRYVGKQVFSEMIEILRKSGI